MTARHRALVVFESSFGNTETLARVIAEELERCGVDTEVCPVADAPPAVEVTADLVVLGAPTHAFSLSRRTTRMEAVRRGGDADAVAVGVRDWLEGCRAAPPQRHLSCAFFDTRVTRARHLPGSAARSARRHARDAGLSPTAAQSFYVEDVTGPLAPGELERARSWARALCPTSPSPTTT